MVYRCQPLPGVFGYIENQIQKLPKPLMITFSILFYLFFICFTLVAGPLFRLWKRYGAPIWKRIDENPHYRHYFWSKKAKQREKDRLKGEETWREYEVGREQRKKVRFLPSRALDEYARGRETGMTWTSPVNMQLDSPFWAVLPLELRMLIWREVCGGYLIHMIWEDAYRRIVHKRYKGDTGFDLAMTGDVAKEANREHIGLGSVDFLGALLVCRRMYEETLPVLYSENTFIFFSMEDILCLSLTIPYHQMLLFRRCQWKAPRTVDDYRPYRPGSTNSPWPQCIGTDDCYCLRCWNFLQESHYEPNQNCFPNEGRSSIICYNCWERNPALKQWVGDLNIE